MAEQRMDVRWSVALVRRRWRVVAAAAAAGLVLGTAYALLVPAQLGSTSLVLLPGAGGTTTDGDIVTQLHIVVSDPVLAAAGSKVSPKLSADDVRQRVAVDAATPQLMEIEAFSDRPSRARALSQAVSEAYVSRLQENSKSLTQVTLSDLTSRQHDLTTQLTNLQKEIDSTSQRQHTEDATSYAGRRDAQLLAQLTAEQANVSLQLDKVKQDIADYGTLGGVSATALIIQPAGPATGSGTVVRLVASALAGALLAAAAAVLFLMIRARRDPRVQARDDIADAVASSVLADVRSRRQNSVAEWLALLETYEAPAVDAWAFRQILRSLTSLGTGRAGSRPGVTRTAGRVEHPRSVTVLSMAGDERGLAVGPQLAAFTASLGIVTHLIVASGQESVPSLWAACAADRGSALRPGLTLEAGDASVQPLDAPAVPEHVDLTVVVVVPDRARPTMQGVPRTVATVLAIAPGVAAREELARLAVAVDDDGRRIDGVVVADPEPADRTTGRRTYVERSRHAPLPLRVTGVSQVPAPAGERGKSR